MTRFVHFRFGPFEFDAAAFRLRRNGTPVPLEPKALDLLQLLIDRAPGVVEKSAIFACVWKDVAVTDNALTRVVAQLRRTLEDDPKAPRYIETVATRGYRFVAPVVAIAHDDVARENRASPVELRNRRTAVVAAAIALACAIGVWAAARFVSAKPADAPAVHVLPASRVAELAALRPEQLTTGRGYDGFLAFAPDGTSIAYSSDRSGALEIYVEGRAPGSTPTALTHNGMQNIQPAWSPDGRYIAFHDMARNGIWVVPSRGGTAQKVADFGSHPAWSPDGRLIAFQSLPANDIAAGIGRPGALSTIWTVAADGSEIPVAMTLPGQPEGPHLAPSWEDRSHVMFAAVPSEANGRATSLWSVDVSSHHAHRVLEHPSLTPTYALVAGRGVYFVSKQPGSIWWLPLHADGEGGAPDPQPTGLPVAGASIAQLALSADGRRLAWTTTDSSHHIWMTDRQDRGSGLGDAAPLTEGLGVHYGFPTPSTDGRLAMVGNRTGSDQVLFLIEPGSSLPRQLTPHAGHHGGPRWLPGEREIGVITNHQDALGFWALDPSTGRERPLFRLRDLPVPAGESQPSTAAPATNIAIADDFSRFAMAFVTDGRPNIWVGGLRSFVPDGSLAQRTFETGGGSYPVWSPNGQWIAYQCTDGTDTHVCVVDAASGGRVQLTHDAGQSWVGGWAPDNDTIVFAARRDAVWNVAAVSRSTRTVRTLTRFTEPRAYVRYPRWDPAHQRVVFERSETTARIWSVGLPE